MRSNDKAIVKRADQNVKPVKIQHFVYLYYFCFAQINYQGTFIQNGALSLDNLATNDPLRYVFAEIKKQIAPGIDNKENKIKTIFSAK